MLGKKRYIIVLVQEQQGIYSILKKRRFNPIKPEISYKKKAFPVDVNTPSYSKGLNFYYFVDIKAGQLTYYSDINSDANPEIVDMILYNDINSDANPEIVDMILYKKIISQLTANMSGDAYKLNIITLVIGAVMGGLLGYIIGAGGFV